MLSHAPLERGRESCPRPSLSAGLRATRNVAFALFCVVLPVILVIAVAVIQSRAGAWYFDFLGTVWEPSRALVAGQSPFPAATSEGVDVGNPALYPPAVVLVALPILALPFPVAAAVWVAGLVGAVALSLWILGVRDLRAYVLALTSWPVVWAAVLGNVTLILILAVAVAWTYRDRSLVVGAAIGLAVAVKLFLWPLGVWLLVTRRVRASAATVLVAGAAVLLPWAAIGFAGLRDYPHLLRLAEETFAAHSNSLFAGALGLGLARTDAHALAFTVGAALLVLTGALARRADGDRRSFSAALAAALVLTPIVWAHYFALLLVPLAILRPRLDRVWLAVPATWLVFLFVPLPRGTSEGKPAGVPAEIWEPLHAASPALWQTLAYTALGAVVVAACLRRAREGAA
jgi:hypothetical protein